MKTHCIDNLVEKLLLHYVLSFHDVESRSVVEARVVRVLTWCKLEDLLLLIRLIETWR